MKKMRLLFVVLGLMLPCTGAAQSYRTVSLGAEDSWPLTHAIYYFPTYKALTPIQAYHHFGRYQADSLPQGRFTHGYDSHYYWYYLKLHNEGTSRSFVLNCNRADIHVLKCFAIRHRAFVDTLASTGDALPFDSRPFLLNDFAVPFSLAAQEAVDLLVLVDKRNEFITGRFSLKRQEAFFDAKRKEFGWFMGFLGVVGVLLIFNLFLWFSLRDMIHLLYMAQLASMTLGVSASLGYLHEFFHISIPYITSTLVVGLVCLWSGLNFFLLIRFLKITPTTSKLYRLNAGAGIGSLLAALLCFLGIFVVVYPLSASFMKGILFLMESLFAINTGVVIATILEQFRKKNAMTLVYSVAWFFLALGSVFSFLHRNFSLASLSYVGDLFGDLGWIIPGVLFEQITLALGLTVRYNQLKKENLELDLYVSKTRNEMAESEIRTQEAERQRLAQDLHDDLGGTLSAIRGKLSGERAKSELVALVDQVIRDLRIVSRNLMPPELEKEGLVATIRHTVERLQDAASLRFTFISFGKEVTLGKDRELHVYRVTAELMTNIVRHSRATEAVIQLIYFEDSLTVSVEDNGVGIKTDEKSWGIGYKNISSRVGQLGATLHVDSSPHGTTVMIRIPFTQSTNV